MRIRSTGQGKSGGARVHYLYLPSDKIIQVIFMYSKSEQATLTTEQKKQLRAVAEAFKKER
jgi:hypothetical protein